MNVSCETRLFRSLPLRTSFPGCGGTKLSAWDFPHSHWSRKLEVLVGSKAVNGLNVSVSSGMIPIFMRRFAAG